MYFDYEQTVEEKIHELEKVLTRPQELKSLSEGSNIILLVIQPQQEPYVTKLIQKKFPKSLMVNCSTIFLDSVEEYGIQNLKDDFEFSENGFLQDFAHFLFENLKNSIIKEIDKYNLIFLSRVGLFNEIIRVNTIVESLTNCLRAPMVILYPGQKKDHTLTYLNGRHRMSIYRAYKI